jgi:hypothetical protein
MRGLGAFSYPGKERCMKRVVCGAVVMGFALAATLGAQAPAQEQGRAGGAPPPPTNLQVLPKDIPRAQLLQAMQAFNQALGVQCSHCHQFVGPGDPTNDMASDVKPQKNIARAMIRMVGTIRPAVTAAVPTKAATDVRVVGCWTCHRGQAIPEAPPPLPARGGGAPGAGPGAGAPPAGR